MRSDGVAPAKTEHHIYARKLVHGFPALRLRSLATPSGTTRSVLVRITPRRREDLLPDLVAVIVVATRSFRDEAFIEAALVALDLIQIVRVINLILSAVVVG